MVETACEDHCVVVGFEFVHGHVAAQIGVADEPRPGIGEEKRRSNCAASGFGALVVGGDAVAQQSVGHGQPVVDVGGGPGHLAQNLLALKQPAGPAPMTATFGPVPSEEWGISRRGGSPTDRDP